MNTDFDNDYKHALKLTKGNEVAASILVLADNVYSVSRQLHDFDHQICMGIRYGLFGSGHSIEPSILDLRDSD